MKKNSKIMYMNGKNVKDIIRRERERERESKLEKVLREQLKQKEREKDMI